MKLAVHALVLPLLLLVPGTGAAEVVQDQGMEESPYIGQRFFDTNHLAQTFTAGVTGTLVGVDIGIYRSFDVPVADVVLEVRDTVGGSPGPTLLGTGTFPAASVATTQGVFVSFDLSAQGIQVAEGQFYALVARSAVTANNADGTYTWPGAGQGGSYAGGSAWQGPGDGSWTESSVPYPYDRVFRTWVDVPDAADALDEWMADAAAERDGVEGEPSWKRLDKALRQAGGAVSRLIEDPPDRVRAIKALGKASKSVDAAERKGLDAAVAMDLREALLSIAAELAAEALEDAEGGDAGLLALAAAEIATGDEAAAGGDSAVAFKAYARAAALARKAEA